MSSDAEPDVERLARFVKSRRLELGLGQRALRGRGGPSVVTVVRVEAAKVPPPGGLSLAAFDRALRWEHGSAERILAGGDPDPLQEEAEPRERVVVLDEQSPEETAAEEKAYWLSQCTLEELLEEVRRRVPAPVADEVEEAAVLELPRVARKRSDPRKRRT